MIERSNKKPKGDTQGFEGSTSGPVSYADLHEEEDNANSHTQRRSFVNVLNGTKDNERKGDECSLTASSEKNLNPGVNTFEGITVVEKNMGKYECPELILNDAEKERIPEMSNGTHGGGNNSQPTSRNDDPGPWMVVQKTRRSRKPKDQGGVQKTNSAAVPRPSVAPVVADSVFRALADSVEEDEILENNPPKNQEEIIMAPLIKEQENQIRSKQMVTKAPAAGKVRVNAKSKGAISQILNVRTKGVDKRRLRKLCQLKLTLRRANKSFPKRSNHANSHVTSPNDTISMVLETPSTCMAMQPHFVRPPDETNKDLYPLLNKDPFILKQNDHGDSLGPVEEFHDAINGAGAEHSNSLDNLFDD
ncbi:hypothetical protein RIF29_40324 [Crotalaria pallida]|uniref:Uncharacterized protein n=1 Tax=Crotalaria pallida TaxID=3830 RepID=A0AAN9HU84_CROPI